MKKREYRKTSSPLFLSAQSSKTRRPSRTAYGQKNHTRREGRNQFLFVEVAGITALPVAAFIHEFAHWLVAWLYNIRIVFDGFKWSFAGPYPAVIADQQVRNVLIAGNIANLAVGLIALTFMFIGLLSKHEYLAIYFGLLFAANIVLFLAGVAARYEWGAVLP